VVDTDNSGVTEVAASAIIDLASRSWSGCAHSEKLGARHSLGLRATTVELTPPQP